GLGLKQRRRLRVMPRLVRAWWARGDRGTDIFERQVERESAPLAGRAAELNLSAQQARQLAADRQPQSRTAVFAAGACVRLLKRLEDHSLLVEWNADAGVRNLEGDHRRRAAQHGMVGTPAAHGRRHIQTHAAMARE